MKRLYEKVITEKFSNLNILVIGDIMIDEYVVGSVTRISPEAPIPILNFKERSCVAGGAANVAKNILAMGAKVSIVGIVGADAEGQWLKEHLKMQEVLIEGIVADETRPTTVKRRFATKNQQLLRLDIEKTNPITEEIEREIYGYLIKTIDMFDAVVLSDYQKGLFLNPEFVQKIIKLCKKNHKVVTIDSKSGVIEQFEDATFVKPNNLELEKAVGIMIEDDKTLDEAGNSYLKRSGAEALVVTRGSKGISLFVRGQARRDYPSRALQVYDVTGAGDTVISAITMAVASGMPLENSIELGNIAAGIAISRVGTVSVKKEELLEAIYEK